jgi:hypothetical protein
MDTVPAAEGLASSYAPLDGFADELFEAGGRPRAEAAAGRRAASPSGWRPTRRTGAWPPRRT